MEFAYPKVGVVHADRLLRRREIFEDAHLVRHHGRLVEGRLAVHDHHVAVHEMAPDRLPFAGQQSLRESFSAAWRKAL